MRRTATCVFNSSFCNANASSPIFHIARNMNNSREPSMVFNNQEDQHPNKAEVFSENASKRIKLDSIPLEEETKPDQDIDALELEQYDDDDILNQKNPFLFAPVLSVLFSHMDIETLKMARQVCHLWKNESLPIFKARTEAMLNLEEICHSSCDHRKVNARICYEFLKVMNRDDNNDELPFENLCINLMDMRCKGKMSRIFRKYGSKITALNIWFYKPRFEDDDDNLSCFFRHEDFKLILIYWCTNLKSLKLINIPFNLAESEENIFSVKELIQRKSYIPGGPLSSITSLELIDDREYFPLGKMIVFHIFKVSPLLSSLEIDVEDDEAFDAFIDGLLMARKAGFLPNLNSLIFGTRFGCIFYENHLVSLIAMKLHKLKKLEILNMGQDVSVESLNTLFVQCKDSLEVFQLDVTTPFSDKSEFPNQFLYLPKMNNLKHLEIKCNSIQLCESSNLIRQFPNMKTCTLDTNCDCGYQFTGRHWNSVVLECSEFTYFDDPYSKSAQFISPIRFIYKAHCVKIFQRIIKWFPTAQSLYADKGKDRFGLVDLFRAMSETSIKELHLEVSCSKSNGSLCCLNNTVEEEEAEVEKLLQQSKCQGLNKNECGAVPIFPELWNVSIVTKGCRNINLEILRQLGILHLVENAPVLSDFVIQYCYKTCSKTAIIYDLQSQLFEAEQ